MRRLVWLSTAGTTISLAILGGLYLPGAPTEPVFWLGFPFAFVGMLLTFRAVTGSLSRRPRWEELWELLPVPARISLGLLLAATTVQLVLVDKSTQLGFTRGYVGACLWLCVVSAALAYAMWRRDTRESKPGE